MATAKSDQQNVEDDMKVVPLPSGSAFKVHNSELGYFMDRCDRYQKDNHFSNISDIQDIDRLIITELLVWRWEIWVSQNHDYWGDEIDEVAYARQIKDHSAEIRQLKKALGLDKETRDKQRGEDSVDAYINALRQRAKEFGYMRDEQSAKSIELFQQLSALVTLYHNCDDGERHEQKCTEAHIIAWITDKAMPEFEEIDEEFRDKKQKMWIRKQ
jgi:hypothetical protein